MPKINVLDKHVAELIAAGEVVDRPCSVVKELVENSVDAGATNITVEIKDGGNTFIRVTDDGCGIEKEDIPKAFMRHATSKIGTEYDLERICTFGFRGEALASIAAVSHTEMLTRVEGADIGYHCEATDCDIGEPTEAGCPVGTTIVVRDLFYNTPARQKFLKKDVSEANAVAQIMDKLALSYPEVKFNFIRDGETKLSTYGNGDLLTVISSVYGREFANNMLEVNYSSMSKPGFTVKGYITRPSATKASRSFQNFFINRRFVKTRTAMVALEEAFKGSAMVGKYPGCILNIVIPPETVDVNVHPAKTEVKFSEEKKVFDAVYQTVRSALEAEDKPLEISLSEGTKKLTESASATFNDRPRTTFSRPSFSERPAPVFKPAPARAPQSAVFRSPMPEYDSVFPASTKSENVEKAVETVEKIASPAYRLIGEALNTYILVEFDGKLLLIDKHAAHERMIFDRLVQSEREVMSQTLLEPILVRLSPEDSETLEANGETLSELGFELEPFGEGAYALRALPEDIDPGDAAAAVEELCVKLRTGGADDAKAGRTELLHTVACKAAIKAGRRHDPAELDRIAKAVVSGEVRYCPHGRPVSVTLTKAELDKFFSRIV